MTNWSVQWSPEAEEDLAVLWLQATDRSAVTAAQDQIDRLLSRDPLAAGEELSEGLWKLTVDPLKVYYTVDPQDRQVSISDVYFS